MTQTMVIMNNESTLFITEYQNLLIEAEELHQSALKITIDAFGEVNVQTAKHYGNLGRLYQSMAKYQVSIVSFSQSHKLSIVFSFLMMI